MRDPLTKIPALQSAHPKVERTPEWLMISGGLQEEIISGLIHPRQHLVEDEVMDRFGVSRHTARRALDELERVGLATRERNRGVFVRSYTESQVLDIYEMREMLETRAASRIRIPGPDELIAALSSIEIRHEEASDAGKLSAIITLNDEFHRTLYSTCGNKFLSDSIASYSLQTQSVRMHFSFNAHWRSKAVQDHWHMIRIIAGEAQELLADVCYEHLQGPKQNYLKMRHALTT